MNQTPKHTPEPHKPFVGEFCDWPCECDACNGRQPASPWRVARPAETGGTSLQIRQGDKWIASVNSEATAQWMVALAGMDPAGIPALIEAAAEAVRVYETEDYPLDVELQRLGAALAAIKGDAALRGTK